MSRPPALRAGEPRAQRGLAGRARGHPSPPAQLPARSPHALREDASKVVTPNHQISGPVPPDSAKHHCRSARKPQESEVPAAAEEASDI